MAVLIGRGRIVKDIIETAISQGCVLRETHIKLVMPDGTIAPVRFLHNPKTGGRFSITEYDDDDFMLQSEWVALERRLSISLPKLP